MIIGDEDQDDITPEDDTPDTGTNEGDSDHKLDLEQHNDNK